MLESWYAHVAAVVAAHGGDVVKFTGDSLLILRPFARAAGSDEAARRRRRRGALRARAAADEFGRRVGEWRTAGRARVECRGGAQRRRGAAVDAAALAAAAAAAAGSSATSMSAAAAETAPRDGSRMGAETRAVAPLPRRSGPAQLVGDAAQALVDGALDILGNDALGDRVEMREITPALPPPPRGGAPFVHALDQALGDRLGEDTAEGGHSPAQGGRRGV